jgi:hypothetical protein
MPILPIGDSILTISEVVLGFMAVYAIPFGFFRLPRWLLKARTKAYSNNSKILLSFNIIRVGLFESIAIYGLILGILGAGAQITIPFLVVSAGTLILTFPTEERWKKMIESLNSYPKPE